MLKRVSNTGLEPVTHGQNHALPTELITHLLTKPLSGLRLQDNDIMRIINQ